VKTAPRFPQVKARKDAIVAKHSKGVEMLLKRAKVERISVTPR